MKQKLEALLKIKDKHIADTQAGNPPPEAEVTKLRQHLRAVQAAIEAVEKVAFLEKEIPLSNPAASTSSNPATSNTVTATSTSNVSGAKDGSQS